MPQHFSYGRSQFMKCLSITFSSAIGKQLLLPELRKQGVEFDVRAVNVGDFLWVARPKGECWAHVDP